MLRSSLPPLSLSPSRGPAACLWRGAAALAVAMLASRADAAPKGSAACYTTGGGALEICRSDDEAEGV